MTTPRDWTGRIGRRVKLRDLHILLAVAHAGSMGKAAADLAVSQPVVSKAIADLEHALGLRLLDRSPQGVEMTLYGREVLKCGTAVFDDLRKGVEALEFLSDPTSGKLRIGCTEPLAAGFVGAVIERLSRKYPRAAFHVITADPGQFDSALLKLAISQRQPSLRPKGWHPIRKWTSRYCSMTVKSSWPVRGANGHAAVALPCAT